MSNRSWKIFITAVVLIVLSAFVYDKAQSRTSFQELVLDHLNEPDEIKSIHLYKEDDEERQPGIEITDSDEINEIMKVFSGAKLKVIEQRFLFEDSYKMYIYTKSGPSFYVVFNDQKLIRIDNSETMHKKYNREYEVTNDFDITKVTDLFNE